MAFTGAWTSVGVGWGTGNATAGNRELALNIVTIIDPTETPTLSVMSTTTTNSLYHDYSVDALAATSIVPAGEGADFNVTAYSTAKNTARIQNYVMRFRKDIEVTNDQLEMSRRGQAIGIDDYMRYEAGKGTKEVTRNGNVKLWNVASASGSALVAGASTGTNSDAGATGQYSEFRNLHWFARNCGGLGTGFSGGLSSSAMATNQSGAFGTAAFYGLQAAMWSAGAKPDTLFVSGPVKTQVSRTLLNDSIATAGGLSLARNNTAVSGNEYGPIVDVVRTDYGRVAVIMDRWIPTASATATSDAWAGAAYYLAERSKLRQAWWRPITPYPLPPAGDSVRMYVQGAFTVEVLHPKCLGIAYGVTS